jgi:hypothetical protein
MRRRPTAKEYLPFSFFVLFWLAPVAYVGLVHGPVPLAGRYLNDEYNVGCLFIGAPLSWDSYHVEIHQVGSAEWKELPRDEVSTMQPFGHTTRFEMLLARSSLERRGVLQRQRMAEFVRDRYAARHPGAAPVDQVRFSLTFELVSEYAHKQAAHAGPWEWRPLAAFPSGRIEVMSIHFFDGRLPLGGRDGPVSDALWKQIQTCAERE